MSIRTANLGPLIALGVSALIAILLGVALANPQNAQTILGLGATLGVLLIPLLIKHHQLLLVALINAPIDARTIDPCLVDIVVRASSGMALTEGEVVRLFATRGAEFG